MKLNERGERSAFSRAIGHIRTNVAWSLLWADTIVAEEFVYRSDILPERGSLPDVIDVQDHIGNIPESTFLGGIGALATCAVLRLSAAPPTVQKVALGAAFTVGVIANVIAETKFGQQLVNLADIGGTGYTPNQDPLDFAYGMVGAVAGGALLVQPKSEVRRGWLPGHEGQTNQPPASG